MSTSEKDKKKKEAAAAAFIDKTEAFNGSTHSSVFGRRMIDLDAKISSADNDGGNLSTGSHGESSYGSDIPDEGNTLSSELSSASGGDNDPEKDNPQSLIDAVKRDREERDSNSSTDDDGMDDRMLSNEEDNQSSEGPEEENAEGSDGEDGNEAPEDADNIIENPKNEKEQKYGRWHKNDKLQKRKAHEEYLRRQREEQEYYNQQRAEETRQREEEEYLSQNRARQQEEQSEYHNSTSQGSGEKSSYLNTQFGKHENQTSSEKLSRPSSEEYISRDVSDSSSAEDASYLQHQQNSSRSWNEDQGSSVYLDQEEQRSAEESPYHEIQSERSGRDTSGQAYENRPSSEEYLERNTYASRSEEDDSYLQQSMTRSGSNDQDSSVYINHEEHRSSEESPYREVQPERSGQAFSDHGSDSRPSAESYLNEKSTASQTEEDSAYLYHQTQTVQMESPSSSSAYASAYENTEGQQQAETASYHNTAAPSLARQSETSPASREIAHPSSNAYLSRETTPQTASEGVYLKQDRAEREEKTYLSRETTKSTSDSYLGSQKTPDTESSYMPADRHTATETPYLHNEAPQSPRVSVQPSEGAVISGTGNYGPEAEQVYGRSGGGSLEGVNGGQQGISQTTDYGAQGDQVYARRPSAGSFRSNGSPTIVSQTENMRHPDGFADQEAAGNKTAGIVNSGQTYADETHGGIGQNFGLPQANAAGLGAVASIPTGTDMAATERYFSAKGIHLASMDNDAVQRAVGRGSINGRPLNGREQEAVQNYLSARKAQAFLGKEKQAGPNAGISQGAGKGATPISRNATVGNGNVPGSSTGLTEAGGAIKGSRSAHVVSHGAGVGSGNGSDIASRGVTGSDGTQTVVGKTGIGGRQISRNATVVTRGAEVGAEPTKGMTANEILQFRKMQQKTGQKSPWISPGKGKKADGPYLSQGISSDGKPYLGQAVPGKEAGNGPYLVGNGKDASSPLPTMTAAQRLLYLKTNGKATIVGKGNSIPAQSGAFSDAPAYVTVDRAVKSGPQAVKGPLTLGNVRNNVYISHGQITGVDQLAGKARMVHPEDGNLTGKASMDSPLAGKSSIKGIDNVNVLSSGKARIGKVQNSAMDKLSGENGLGLSSNGKLNAGASVSRQKMSFGRTIGRPKAQGPTGKMNDPTTVSAMWKKNQPKIFQRTLLAKQQNAGGNPVNSVFSSMLQTGTGKGIGGGGDGIVSVLKKAGIIALILIIIGQFSGSMMSSILAMVPRAAMVDMDGNKLDDYGTYPGTDYNATNTSGGSSTGSTGSTVSDVADPNPSGDGTYKYGDYTITERDIKWLTAVVCHEEGWDLATHDERVGIAAIILHRLVRNEEGWPNTIQGVINQPGQFYTLTDAEVNTYSTDPSFSKNYADCRRAAIEAVCGVDPTGGAVGEVASYVDPTKLVLKEIWQKQIGRTIFYGWGNTPQVSTTTMVGGGNFNGGTKAITQNAVNAMLNVEYEAMQKAQEEGREYQLVSNNKSTAFENLSIYSVSCNGTSLATNTVTTKNYLDFTTDYTYYGQPLKKGTGSSKVTYIRKPKMKKLKASDKTGDTLTITYHGTNTTVSHTYYSGSKTQQYFGNCDGMEDTLDIDNKSLLGWAFQEHADGTDADDSIIAYDRYDKISGDTISMLAEQYGGQLDLYAVYANAKARVKHDKIGVFTDDDLSKGADEYLNGDKAVTIRYAYRDKNGNMNYTDQNGAVTSAARAQIYKNILAMATIVTGNQTKHPDRYIRYCEERMKDVIGGYAGVSIDYTPVKLSGGTHDKEFRYTWHDGFTKYVAPGARLKVTATIYVTQNLEAMCKHDPTNESYFDDNPDFFTFPGWTKVNINQAEVYAQLEDKEFCTLFNVIIPEIDPSLISGSGDGSDMVAAAMEEYNSYHGQTGGMKYISWFGGFGPGTAWCNIFVSYVANKCGYIKSGIIPKSAGCANTYAWFEKKGLTHRSGTYTPKAGDLIFFGPNASEHIGIVEKCENGVVYTIEGNYSDTIGRGSYPLSRSSIWGYASPQYPSSVTSGDGSESYVYKTLKKQGLNDVAIAGIMGNMQSEGGVTGWHNAENSSYATDAADRQYTANVDNGSISRHDFVYDGVGYGPVQLTYYSYKETLYDNAKAAGKSIGDPGIMMSTIIQLYKGHFAQMNAAGSPEAAAAYWLNNVERPLNPDPSVRGAQARTYYNKILSGAYK